MEKIKRLLKSREKELLKIRKEKEQALSNAPDGSLRLCCRGNRIQYYLRDDPKDFNGHYIREKDAHIAQKLAQKDYDKKILTAADKELKAICSYLSACPKFSPEQIYDNLHHARQRLITPILKPEQEYIRDWQSVPYQGLGFLEDYPEFYTEKKERVRSKSEVLIANLLHKEKIPYRYECPLYLSGYGTIHPDFTILDIKNRKELYLEHLGMMDDPVYAEKALQKLAAYEENGIFPGEQLILTYETRKNPLNQKLLLMKIKKYLK